MNVTISTLHSFKCLFNVTVSTLHSFKCFFNVTISTLHSFKCFFNVTISTLHSFKCLFNVTISTLHSFKCLFNVAVSTLHSLKCLFNVTIGTLHSFKYLFNVTISTLHSFKCFCNVTISTLHSFKCFFNDTFLCCQLVRRYSDQKLAIKNGRSLSHSTLHNKLSHEASFKARHLTDPFPSKLTCPVCKIMLDLPVLTNSKSSSHPPYDSNSLLTSPFFLINNYIHYTFTLFYRILSNCHVELTITTITTLLLSLL